MSSIPAVPARWNWVRRLDAVDLPAATSVAARRQARALLGDGAVRWAVGVGARMTHAILNNFPERPTDHSEEERDVLRRGCEAATLETLIAVVTGDVGTLARSTEPTLSARYNVRRGIAVEQVVRNAQAAQAHLIQELSDAIDHHLVAAERMVTRRELTRLVNEAWAPMEAVITAAYATEYERWTHSEMGRRLALVTAVLEGQPLDVDAASRDLCYHLDERHVGAVLRVDSTVATVGVNVLAMAHALAMDAGCSGVPLLLSRGHHRADVWFADPQLDLAETAADSAWPAGLMIALGDPAESIEGFRSTHRQAGAACRVAWLRGRADRVTHYADVELLAVLTAELDLSVAMARKQLGPLASKDVRMAELRETLAAYLDLGANISQTALAIHAHRNTVTYRLRQIDRLLPASHEHTELRAALLLAHEIPHLVLSDVDPAGHGEHAPD